MNQNIFILCFVCLLAACSQYDLDGKIVRIDGQVYELHHVVGDTFKTHRIEAKELDKVLGNPPH